VGGIVELKGGVDMTASQIAKLKATLLLMSSDKLRLVLRFADWLAKEQTGKG